MEHWIWSNKQGAWVGQDPYKTVTLLQEAGRFCEGIARKMADVANQGLSDTEYPDQVIIQVTNDYLFPEGRRLVNEYVITGDLGPLDEAFFKARDAGLVRDNPELIESWEQALRGEGVVLRSEGTVGA